MKATKLKDKPKEIRILLNRVSSLLSLKRISTLGDMLDILGETWDSMLYPPRETPLTFDLFRKLKSEIEARLVSGAQQVKVSEEEDTLALDGLYTTNDFLIDSEEYIGQLSAKERRAQAKPWEHWELWDSIATPLQRCDATYFQEEAARQLMYQMVVLGYRGQLLRANTGDGKTFAYGRLIRKLIDSHWLDDKSMSPYRILVVTKASIVDQTKLDLTQEYGVDLIKDCVLVTHYDALRSSFGEEMLEEITKVQDGIPYTEYKWKPFMHPCVVFWDECQALKNDTSKQHAIASAFNNINFKHMGMTYQVFVSASPFAKVASAKCFCVATRIPFKHGLGETELSNKLWTLFTAQFTDNPYDYNKTAMKKLLKVMNPYIVGFKNVRRKHKANNMVRGIAFETPEKRQKYEKAFETYLKKKSEIEGSRNVANSAFLILVEFLKFRQAAEFLRAETIARLMWEAERKGLAPICACNFKATIAKVVKVLHMDYGVTRDKISLIWGGDASFVGGVKFTPDQIKDMFRRTIQGEELSNREMKAMYNQLIAEEHGLTDLPADLQLGIQSRKDRWNEIQKFQNGEAVYCFFTFGAGGAGLSLHHKFTHTRQRWTLVAPTYNEMELYQAMGRAPRLTSLSDTEQVVLLYKDTIEESVLNRVAAKTSVLQAVIDHSEKYETKEVDAVLKLTGARAAIEEADEDEEDAIGEEIFDEVEKGSNEQ